MKIGSHIIYKAFLLLLSLGIIAPLLAQSIELDLEGELDCATKKYCVSIQLQAAHSSLTIGTSSIFLQYNADALSFAQYTSSHFNGSGQCIQGVAPAWDIQTFDATSMPGFFNLTMTLLTNEFSCPAIEQTAIEVGVICFDIKEDEKNPNIQVIGQNTSFNSSEPNTGERLIKTTQQASIKDAKLLQCTATSLSDCATQKDLWEDDQMTLTINQCDELATFCTGIPFSNSDIYELEVNGVSVEHIEQCSNGITSFFYTYSSFLKLEEGGDFEVVKWMVGEQTYTGSFKTTVELIDLLNKWDPKGEWAIDPTLNTIYGGASTQEYMAIEIKNNVTGLSIGMGLNKKTSPAAASILLPEGQHKILAKNRYTNCMDQIEITIVCEQEELIASERVEIQASRTLMVSSDTLWCLDQLVGAEDFMEDCSEKTGAHSEIRIDNQTHCISILANTDGVDKYCFYICDQEDNCRTLEVNVEVTGSQNPILRNDIVSVMMNNNAIIDVKENDIINGEILDFGVPAIQRMDGSLDVDHDDIQIIYTPSYNVCGIQDSFQYYLANHRGKGLATVKVDVLCEELTVFSGFSPNGDGINDYFKIMGIENFEQSELVIFNSRGNQVYSKKGYRNDDGWDGRWKGKNLPDNTYFYILFISKDRQPISGYIQLQR